MITPCGGLIMLVITAVTLAGFAREHFREQYLFSPERVLAGKEYFRVVTSGFLHADGFHLLFNLYSFYAFAEGIEWLYGGVALLVIFLSAVVGGNLLALYLHRHQNYRALGASGGVCGVIFAHIFLVPGGGIGFMFLPVYIPAWAYAVLFLVGSYFMRRSGRDNVGHDAHLGGAIIGLITATVMYPRIVSQSPLLYLTVLLISGALFWHMVKHPLYLPGAGWFKTEPEEDNHPRYSTKHLQEPREVDRILDKISRHGIESLTKEERDALNHRSEKLRRRDGEP